jgi:transcriptional regulator with XRE-family HTH domain
MTKTATKRPASSRHSLSTQLKDIIESRGLTAYAVGRSAGVDPGVVQRFLSGERDIRLETADRIGAALGLRLVELGRKVRGRPARGEDPAPEPETASGRVIDVQLEPEASGPSPRDRPDPLEGARTGKPSGDERR